MATKTFCIIVGVAALVGPVAGCAVELDSGDDDARPIASEDALVIPGIVRAIEGARALDRSRGLAARENAPAAVGEIAATITVSGRVLQLNGSDVAFVSVAIPGQGAALTDAVGNFTIPNVTTPYDIVVALHQSDKTSAIVYRGLTRPDPRLIGFPASGFTAELSGTVSGGAGFPLPADQETRLGIFTDLTDFGSAPTVDPTTGAYSQTVGWGYRPTTSAHFIAFQFRLNGSGQVTSFTGAAKGAFTLTDGGAVVLPITLSPVTTTTISGTYSLPDDYTFIAKAYATESGSFDALGTVTDSVDTATFSFAAPVIAGQSNLVLIAGSSPTGSTVQMMRRNVPAGATGIAIDVPRAADMVFPFDGATGVDHDTTFLTTDFPEGIFLFQWFGRDGVPSFTLVSAEPVAQIPDLSSLGISLPASASYSFSPVELGRFTGMDDFTAPTGPLPSPDLIIANTNGINFTTSADP